MKASLVRLRDKLGSDAAYFQQVYNYAFEFSRPQGQRSLGTSLSAADNAVLNASSDIVSYPRN
jgi:DCN1-like protein 1/2